MDYIIRFFKWLGQGIASFISWISGVPALLGASILGLVASVRQVMGALYLGGDPASGLFAAFDQNAEQLTNAISSVPDIVKLAMYCLSMDVLYSTFLGTFGVIVSSVVVVLTFFFVTVPVWIMYIQIVKMTAIMTQAIFPRLATLNFMTTLSNINVIKPVREALKDGKYNPFLSS